MKPSQRPKAASECDVFSAGATIRSDPTPSVRMTAQFGTLTQFGQFDLSLKTMRLFAAILLGLTLGGCMFFNSDDHRVIYIDNHRVIFIDDHRIQIDQRTYVDGRIYRDERGNRYSFHYTSQGGFFGDVTGGSRIIPPPDLIEDTDQSPLPANTR